VVGTKEIKQVVLGYQVPGAEKGRKLESQSSEILKNTVYNHLDKHQSTGKMKQRSRQGTEKRESRIEKIALYSLAFGVGKLNIDSPI